MFIVPISQMPTIEEIKKVSASTETVIPTENNGLPFADMLKNAMNDAREAEKVAQEDTYKLAMGQTDDLHNVMINSAKATAAVEFAVEVTSRAVSAYNEILRMQI